MRARVVIVSLVVVAAVIGSRAAVAQTASDSTYMAEALGAYLLGNKGWPLDQSKWYGESRLMEKAFVQAVQGQLHAEDRDMLPFCSPRSSGQKTTSWFAMSIVRWEHDSAQVLVTRDGGKSGGCTGQTGQDFFLSLDAKGWKVARTGPPRMSKP